jgi:hypothetical protein
MLKSFVRVGTLKVIDANGGEHVFAGSADGPSVTNAALATARCTPSCSSIRSCTRARPIWTAA